MAEFLTDHQLRVRKRQVLAVATHCALCGKALDFDAPPRTPWSPSVDHKLARELGGDDSWSNLQPSHYGCNAGKGYKATPPMRTSRIW
ncbi:HNH endonuclease [Jatrophihabitans sp. DSM 45814]